MNNIQYTAQFGNGVSATIGLDDPTVFNRTVVVNLRTCRSRATGSLANAYGGVHAPDIVGNIRVDQAWGLFQISAAVHEVTGSYNILNTALPAPAGATGLAGCSSDHAVGNLRSPRHQVGRFGDGCVADQEHPDRCRRRHQDGRDLRQG